MKCSCKMITSIMRSTRTRNIRRTRQYFFESDEERAAIAMVRITTIVANMCTFVFFSFNPFPYSTRRKIQNENESGFTHIVVVATTTLASTIHPLPFKKQEGRDLRYLFLLKIILIHRGKRRTPAQRNDETCKI